MGLTEEQMIERVEAASDAFSRGDFETALRFAHPEIVLVRPGGQSEVRGVETVRKWMEPDAFESMAGELLHRETAGNRVLTRVRTRARGAGSGIEIEIESWGVTTFDDDGRMTRVEFYLQHEEAEARRAFEAAAT